MLVGEWFVSQGYNCKWLANHYDGRDVTAACDGPGRRHWVEGNQPRLLVDDNKGPKRKKRAHNKANRYLCRSCAIADGHPDVELLFP